MTVGTWETYKTLLATRDINLDTLVLGDDGTILPPVRDTEGPIAADDLPLLATSGDLGTVDLAIGETLGQGGMGVVRQAVQVPPSRGVAVKTVRPDGATREARDKLMREALVTGSLEHPNIIPIHTLGRLESGEPASVMKQIQGWFWLRRLYPPNAIQRRLTRALIGATLWHFPFWVGVWMLEISVPFALAISSLLISVSIVTVGPVVDRRIVPASIPFLLGFLAIPAAPELMWELFGLASLLGLGLLGLGWRSDGPAAEPGATASTPPPVTGGD